MWDLDRGEENAALVRGIVELGRALRLERVAEGIETEAQLAELRAAGCGLGQGYLFARPLPAAEASALLRTVPSAATS